MAEHHPRATPNRDSMSLTFRGTTLEAGPAFAIELTGAERLLIPEALGGLMARAFEPWEVTMAWDLARRLEFDRLDSA